MLMPLRLWPIHGGIRPWIGRRWSFMVLTKRIGELGKDWCSDAERVYRWGPFIVFDHGGRK